MKNMKVGRKIFVGFAAVVILMLTIAATVIVTTSLMRVEMDNVKSSSSLQTAVNKLLDGFTATRVQANVIYNMRNEDANAGFRVCDGQVRQLAEEAMTIARSNPVFSSCETEIQRFIDDYEVWSSNVSYVIESNDRLTDMGDESVQVADVIFEVLMDDMRARAGRGAADPALDATLVAIEDVALIRQTLAHIRDTFDGQDSEVIKASIDDVIGVLRASVSTAQTQMMRNSLQNALEAGETLKEQINAFTLDNGVTWDFVDETIVMGDDIARLISALVGTLDADMDAGIDAATDLGKTSIVITAAISALSLLAAVAMGILIARLITVPIQGVSFSLRYFAETGNLSLPPDVQKRTAEVAARKDELGQTVADYGVLMERFAYLAGELDRVASGDLTATINIASENDAMGKALSRMIENLNNMFIEISDAAAHVTSGSQQIARGSQTLAEGATEQSAAIEEFSASLAQIRDQVEGNAQSAKTALRVTTRAGELMGESMQSMDQMLDAMQGIDASAKIIKKVIKAIDDIAFQTNILALNAAVEAARAGQHGKGFAVVAEEVRNLASKSAAAAKETELLIEDSTARVNEGNEIVVRTNEGLGAVEKSTRENLEVISQIVEASDGQARAVNELNTGIGQVSSVVQSNSATAEESASAAEEISAQAVILQRMIERFQLKGHDSGRKMYESAFLNPPNEGEFAMHLDKY